MAFKLPSHLHRSRSGILHFRIAIPPDLRHHFDSREIYRSLQTASVYEAASAAQSLSIAFKRVFCEIRQQSMSDQKKTPTAPLVDLIRLKDLAKATKRHLRLQDTIEERDNHLAEIERRLIEDKAQHERDLALILKARGEFSPAPTPPQSSQNISAYTEPYLQSTPADHRPNEKTLESYRAAINTFIKIVGDKPLLKLSIQDQNRFEDIIVKLPVNHTKVAASRDFAIDEMLQLGLKAISVQNAKNIAQRTNVFLSWAFRREGSKAPFELLDRLKITKKKKGGKKRRAFDDNELTTVFNPATLGKSTQSSPYTFWIPLIGVHTGMRINEIAQLELNDLVTRNGIHCFNVTDAPDLEEEKELLSGVKKIKTEASKRLVPIHQRLIDLGLLDYEIILRAAGHKRLFPDLVGGRDGPGQPASKQFARYCDKIKLTDEALVFHSFRHGAVGRMRSAGVLKELRMVVVGHSTLEDTHDGYGDINNDYSVPDKQRAIEALKFDNAINYAALKNQAPTLTDLEHAMSRNAKRAALKAVKN